MAAKQPHTSESNYPNFMIIGAAKAGTTSLYAHLCQHPEIFLPKEKETHFFEWDALYGRGINFYLNHFFANAGAFPMRGDATPAYLHLPKVVIPRIKKEFSSRPLRFIVLLRDPTIRAWSHYLHMVRIGEENLSFKDALQAEHQRLIETPDRWYGYFRDGLYAEQLQPWLKEFGQEKFFIRTLEEFSSDPIGLSKEVFSFLEVSTDFSPEVSHQNEAGEPRNKLLMKALVASFPGKDLLKLLFPPQYRRQIRVTLRSFNTRPAKYKAELEPLTAVQLREQYKPSIYELENLLGRSFEQWLPEKTPPST